jgi:hypothetical protein
VFFVVNIGDPVGCGYGSETEIVVSTLWLVLLCMLLGVSGHMLDFMEVFWFM